MLGSLILYLKGMRIMMFQLSGFYYNPDSRKLKETQYELKGRQKPSGKTLSGVLVALKQEILTVLPRPEAQTLSSTSNQLAWITVYYIVLHCTTS